MPEGRPAVHAGQALHLATRTPCGAEVGLETPVAHARSAPRASHVKGAFTGPTSTVVACRSAHCAGAGRAIVFSPLSLFATIGSRRIAAIPAALRSPTRPLGMNG